MKKQNRIIIGALFATATLVGLSMLTGCQKAPTLSLGDVPTPGFDAVVGSDGHTVTLVNKSTGASIAY